MYVYVHVEMTYLVNSRSTPRSVELRFSSNDGHMVWFNGDMVASKFTDHCYGDSIDQVVAVTLQPGVNRAELEEVLLLLSDFMPTPTASEIEFMDFFNFGSFIKAIAIIGMRFSVKNPHAALNKSTA